MKTPAVIALYPVLSEAHSWLHCLDWRGDTSVPSSTNPPDDSQCVGWPRGWPNFANRASFGQDIGRDRRPGRDPGPDMVCNAGNGGELPDKEAVYSTGRHGPRAVMLAGQSFVATWPAKNHCDVGQQRGVQFYYTAVKSTPGAPDDWSAVQSKEAWLAMPGHEGLTATYSQCRPQAGGVDRAFCWNTFTLPPTMAAGYYGVMWWWEFNGGEHYNSCAGLQIVSTAAELTSPPAPPPPPAAPSPPPGTPTQASCPPGGGNTNGNCPGNVDCRNDHNCCSPGFACYRKNNFWSGCRQAGTCEPGQIWQDDDPRFKTPWDCTYLGGMCDMAEQQRVNSFQAVNPSQTLSDAEGAMYMSIYGDSSAMAMQVAMQESMMPGGPMTPPVGGPMTPPVGGPMTPPVGGPMTPPVAPPPMMPPMMPPATPPVVAPPVAPVVPPPAPAPVARPPVARPPVAVAGAYKTMTGLLAVLPLFQLLRW